MCTFWTRSERDKIIVIVVWNISKITINLLFLENGMIFDRFTTVKVGHYTNIKC